MESPLADFFETRPISQTEWKGARAPVTVVFIYITVDQELKGSQTPDCGT